MNGSRASAAFPAPTYAEVVLAPAWEHAGHALLEPMMMAHRAWAVMLAERKLLTAEVVAAILRGLDDVDVAGLRERPYDGAHEDLFFAVEEELSVHAGAQAAGSLHLARSRNDLGQALYRMALRVRLLGAVESATQLYEVLVGLGERLAEATMLAHTHTQPAQPTTFGHWMLAAADVLERDLQRLHAAYVTVNRSPLGAAALAGTGFPIDRPRIAALLGFDGLVENSYDAIAGADYFTESAAALQVAAIDTGRVANDLLRWSTAEDRVLRLGDGHVQVSSIMPQKRNPVAFEHVRGMLSRVVGDAGAVLTMVHNTPFGDINDTEDDLQPCMWRAADGFTATIRLLADALMSAQIDVAHLRLRSGAGFATVTNLADHLVVTLGLPFRDAHHVASIATSAAASDGRDRLDPQTIDAAAEAVLGRPLGWSQEQIDRIMDPDAFVRARGSAGGVAPHEVRRMAADRAGRQRQLMAWVQAHRQGLTDAAAHLEAQVNDRSRA